MCVRPPRSPNTTSPKPAASSTTWPPQTSRTATASTRPSGRSCGRETSDRITVHCHIDGAPTTPLPDRVQSALLRIAQGALANVREHSGATTAALTLTYLDDQVVLDVSDNGHGFDPTTTWTDGTSAARDARGPRGHGLPAIRTRAHQLGGTLTIESHPNEGTVLSAAIPLHPATT